MLNRVIDSYKSDVRNVITQGLGMALYSQILSLMLSPHIHQRQNNLLNGTTEMHMQQQRTNGIKGVTHSVFKNDYVRRGCYYDSQSMVAFHFNTFRYGWT